MSSPRIRTATLEDLPALVDIYNHYVVETPITFDLQPFTTGTRRAWFDDHAAGGRHQLLVAVDDDSVLGYATTSRWRPKAAYDQTVESSIYCRADAVGRGIGSLLYSALFDALAKEAVHRIVAGATMPNEASVALHRRFGFRQVGVFTSVGYKFGKYWDVAWFEKSGEPSEPRLTR
jgi:phosphinothricin acetyltransferase